ncbi:MAG: endolytic transglycosylase MltG [Pseudanabaena sp. ELA607]
MSSMPKIPTKKSSRLFYAVAVPVTLLLTTWVSGLWWVWASGAPSTTANKIRIAIPQGMSTQGIARELESAGVIRSSLALRIWLQWQALRGQNLALRSGVYDFPANQTLPDVVNLMQTAKAAETQFTIPEGWTLQQMANLFEQKGFFTATEFMVAAQVRPKGRDWLPANVKNLEGYLFPDTYQINVSQATPEQVIDLMLDRFEQTALPIYKSYRAQGSKESKLSLEDWVTLSSIVEREAVLESERKLIAGVFFNRLRRNMRLESDPTVEYGLNIRQTQENPLTLEQVRTPSPYNTYLNEGLPPGAIGAPSLASLKAVLDPATTDYLFFMARYDGSHIFTRTLEEHERAVQSVDNKLRQTQRR